jgi:hypothetical protein
MKFECVRSGTLLWYALGLMVLSGCATNSAETSPAGPNMQSASLSDPAEVVEARKVFKTELERTPLVKDMVFHTQSGEVRYIEYTDPSRKRVDVIQLTSLLRGFQTPGLEAVLHRLCSKAQILLAVVQLDQSRCGKCGTGAQGPGARCTP